MIFSGHNSENERPSNQWNKPEKHKKNANLMEQNLKTFSIRYMNHRQETEIEADETGDIDSKENSRHDPTKQFNGNARSWRYIYIVLEQKKVFIPANRHVSDPPIN